MTRRIGPPAVELVQETVDESRFRGATYWFNACVPLRAIATPEGMPKNGEVKSVIDGYTKHPDAVPPIVIRRAHGVEIRGQRREFEVEDGHHRYAAARKLGAPCIPSVLELFDFIDKDVPPKGKNWRKLR